MQLPLFQKLSSWHSRIIFEISDLWMCSFDFGQKTDSARKVTWWRDWNHQKSICSVFPRGGQGGLFTLVTQRAFFPAASTVQWPVSASAFQLWTMDGLNQEKNHRWRSRVIQWLVSMKQIPGQNALLLRSHFLSYVQSLSMQSLSLQWHSLPLPTWSS